MNTRSMVVLGTFAVALSAWGGYWLGVRDSVSRDGRASMSAASDHESAASERKVLYYRNPMGLPDISQTPKKDPMGMDYLPVYEGEHDPEQDEGLTNESPDQRVKFCLVAIHLVGLIMRRIV